MKLRWEGEFLMETIKNKLENKNLKTETNSFLQSIATYNNFY